MSRRGALSASVMALDAPRRPSPGEGVGWAVGSLALVAAVAVGLAFGDTGMDETVGLSSAFTTITAIAGMFTAFLVFSHAVSSRSRAYLALGSMYFAVTWLALLLLLVTPGSLLAAGHVWGGPQSAPWTFVSLHFLLPLGVAITAAILWHDGRRYRRPGRATHVTASLLASTAVLVVISLVVTVGEPALPRAITADGSPTTTWTLAWVVVSVTASVAVLLVVALGVARYSLVASWMMGVALLSLAGSLVNLGRPEPFSIGWLVAQVLFALAVLLVPLMMLQELGTVERRATRVAAEDHLTGLTSRMGLLERLEREVARSEALHSPGAFLWVDLDGFKAVNDQFGHAGGDDVLRRVAAQFRRAARPTDTVGRLGGDEFGLLVVDLHGPWDAEVIAARVLQGLAGPGVIDEAAPVLTASIGIVHFPADGTDAEELLHRADLAMYAAKHDGGNQVVTYNEPMASTAAANAEARQRLARALIDDTFELHYQPMVDLGDGRVVGVEALLRWRRDGGLVDASEFIPMAEQTGQIRSIGRLVLELLAEDLDRAGPLPPGFRVAVNLSVPELADPTTADILCRGTLAPFLEHLTIEVTEGVMLADHEPAYANLARMRYAERSSRSTTSGRASPTWPPWPR